MRDPCRALTMRWSKKERDWMYHYPGHKCDGHLIHGFFNGFIGWNDFQKELTERGYDVTTLRLSVELLPEKRAENAQREADLARIEMEDRALRAMGVNP